MLVELIEASVDKALSLSSGLSGSGAATQE